VRDLDQPVVRLDRPRTALEGAVRVHKRRLRHVLRVGRVVQERERVAVHVLDVPSVEELELFLQA
jgi:hypothetical protein